MKTEDGVTETMTNVQGTQLVLGDRVTGVNEKGQQWDGKIVQFSMSIYSLLVQRGKEREWMRINDLEKVESWAYAGYALSTRIKADLPEAKTEAPARYPGKSCVRDGARPEQHQ